MNSSRSAHDLTTEAERIRTVYARRGRRGRASAVISRSYAYLTEERRILTDQWIAEEVAKPDPRFLDVGCGGGGDLADRLATGWAADRLFGVDLVEDHVLAARDRCPGAVIRQIDGATLPFPDGFADVVTASTVFSSIKSSALREALFGEMLRVTAPGGIVVVYDFVVRKPGNNDVLPMPVRRLAEAAGRAPNRTRRVSPFLYLVGVASLIGERPARWAMRIAPRTHRLCLWRVAQPTAHEG